MNFTEAALHSNRTWTPGPASPILVAKEGDLLPVGGTDPCDWTQLISIILKNFSLLAG